MLAPTVVVTTKNRKDELRLALESTFRQSLQVEVVVIDDGSTDGTSELVSHLFPKAKLHRFESSKGLIVRRNEGAQLATGDIIFSIDDDAVFSSENIVEQTLRNFSSPRVGAVAMPFIDVRKDQIVRQTAPAGEAVHIIDAFIGTAHAVRRDVFLAVGGYREKLVHQGEERDYCLRMLESGWVVSLGSGSPIHHFESPRRDFRRMDFYGRRNDILFAWQNVPNRYLPAHLAATTFNGLKLGFKLGRPWIMLRGLLSGYLACLSRRHQRAPVPMKTYALHRELKKLGPCRLEAIEPRLPPMSCTTAGLLPHPTLAERKD